MGTYFYRVNTLHPVLNDKKVRLALAYALNWTQIVDKVSNADRKLLTHSHLLVQLDMSLILKYHMTLL